MAGSSVRTDDGTEEASRRKKELRHEAAGSSETPGRRDRAAQSAQLPVGASRLRVSSRPATTRPQSNVPLAAARFLLEYVVQAAAVFRESEIAEAGVHPVRADVVLQHLRGHV